MNNNISDYSINLLGSDGTRAIIPGTWKTGVLANDTWESESFNIPENFPDGETKIAVRAKAITASGVDYYNQGLDLDGDGRSALNAEDTSVDFFRNFIVSYVG